MSFLIYEVENMMPIMDSTKRSIELTAGDRETIVRHL